MKVLGKIILKICAIADVLFSEKWELTTYKKGRRSSLTSYDYKDFL